MNKKKKIEAEKEGERVVPVMVEGMFTFELTVTIFSLV